MRKNHIKCDENFRNVTCLFVPFLSSCHEKATVG